MNTCFMRLQAGYTFGQTEPTSETFDLLQIEQEFNELDDKGQSKHVYACFGLAAYWGQCLEVSMALLLLWYARASGEEEWTRDIADALDAKFSRRTLGQLWSKVRRLVDFDNHSLKDLNDALEKRNLLSHRFFEMHSADWATVGGRRRMVRELTDAIELFRRTDMAVMVVVHLLARECGMTAEFIHPEGKRMREEWERADA